MSCHGSASPAARLDLTKLTFDPSNLDNFGLWVKVHDRVSAGEMPRSPSRGQPLRRLQGL